MTLGPEVAAPDRTAQVEHRPGREAQRPGELGRPNRGLQRHGRVVAGDGRDVSLAIGRVHGPEVKNEFGFHGLESRRTVVLQSNLEGCEG